MLQINNQSLVVFCAFASIVLWHFQNHTPCSFLSNHFCDWEIDKENLENVEVYSVFQFDSLETSINFSLYYMLPSCLATRKEPNDVVYLCRKNTVFQSIVFDFFIPDTD